MPTVNELVFVDHVCAKGLSARAQYKNQTSNALTPNPEIDCAEYQDKRRDDRISQGQDKDHDCRRIDHSVVDCGRVVDFGIFYVDSKPKSARLQGKLHLETYLAAST